MKNILIISQIFYPDSTAVSQIVTDFAKYLVNEKNSISVITSRHTYEKSTLKLDQKETYHNINIIRLNSTNFGKKTILGRLIDVLTFNILTLLKLILIKKKETDAIIGLTNPPLLPVFCILICKLKKIPFYYWAMDLQPELAIQSNLIKAHSINAKILDFISTFSLKHSTKIIALDTDMKHYIEKKTKNINIKVIPPWSLVPIHPIIDRNKNEFRKKHNLTNKIVIMFAGNHALIHPLDTIVSVANHLKNDSRFCFVFIGEGIQKKKVTTFKEKKYCTNIIQLPFEPLEKIHISLSAADYQVVTMGNNLNGYTHPNKIYGALFSGRKIIYTGPDNSFIGKLLKKCNGNISIRHGDHEKLKQYLLNDKTNISSVLEQGAKNREYAKTNFNPTTLKEKMYTYILSNE